MKYIIAIFLLLPSLCLPAQEWYAGVDLPGLARHHPVSFVIGNSAYVLTGSAFPSVPQRDMYKFDVENMRFTQLADFPGGARSFSYGAAYNGKGYVGFGLNTSAFLNDLWEFDPLAESWKQLKSCPCSARKHPAFLITDNGKLFVGMGDNGTMDFNDWWEYDIATDTWTQRANLPGPARHHPYYFSIGNDAFVGFGHTGSNIWKDFYKYNTSSNTWTRLNDFPGQGRVAGSQFSHAGYGYILSGEGETHQNLDSGEFFRYDPSIDFWQELPAHPGDGRWAPTSFYVNGKVVILAGEDATPTIRKDMLIYNLDAPVGIDAMTQKAQIVIYPNPSPNRKLNISEPVQKVSVFNVLGNELSLEKTGDNQYNIPPTSPSGWYIVRLTDIRGNVYSYRWAVE
jgi:N-acetylneuraminic acid mutarotase